MSDDGSHVADPEAQATRGPNVVAAFTTMFAAATLAVGLRLYTRVKFLYGLKAEDWLILAAWVSCHPASLPSWLRSAC